MNETVNARGNATPTARSHCTRRWLLGLLACLPMLGQAATTVTVKVTVVKPPCTVNDNNPIEVDFGDVMTTRIDGSNYRQPVNYTLSCTGASSNSMKLQVAGTGASFDGTALKTSKTGLGIRLQRGTSTTLAVNNWLNFTWPSKPTLWAVPVMQSGASLTGGTFTAAATLNVDYQ